MTEYQFYKYLLIIFLSLSAAAFVAIFFVTAPYGRYNRPGWGRIIQERWGWLLMESPSFFVFLVFFLLGPNNKGLPAVFFFVLWEAHYIQRSLVYPFLIRGRERGVPLSVIAMAFLFTSINSYLNSRWLFKFSPGYPLSWLTDPRFLAGAALFLAGFVINIHSDHILRSLRAPGESDYKIPWGGLFRYVSCANYFGEIIEWSGWALATWSLPGLGFAVWTMANLVPRARSHHLWYHRTFPDYPKSRRALIPFVV